MIFPEDYINKIINADCIEVMKHIPDNSIDMIITDPPYAVRDDVEDGISEQDKIIFFMQWLSIARKKTDTILMFSSVKHINWLLPLCNQLFEYDRVLIWSKPEGSQLGGSGRDGIFFSYEPILVFKPIKYNPKILEIANDIKKFRESKKLSKGAIDIITRGKRTGLCYRWEEACCLPSEEQLQILKTTIEFPQSIIENINKNRNLLSSGCKEFDVLIHRTKNSPIHPFEKPLEIMKKLVNLYSKEGQIILDPFCGSGTTIDACLQTNRKFIGIEKNKKYFDIANYRINPY